MPRCQAFTWRMLRCCSKDWHQVFIICLDMCILQRAHSQQPTVKKISGWLPAHVGLNSHRHMTSSSRPLAPTPRQALLIFLFFFPPQVNVINSAVCSVHWPSSSQSECLCPPLRGRTPFHFSRSAQTQTHSGSTFSSSLFLSACTTQSRLLFKMRCVSWLLLGTCLLVLGPAVQGVPTQCPSPCHCHGDLQHVICDNVGLKKIPRVSEATRSLNLQNNNLGSIPTGAFSESKGLISLHMQHCKLREIGSQAFKGLKKLVYLYLSHNEINSIKPGAFEDLTELTYLYLEGNQISDLAKGIFSPMINLFTLQLNNNKLRELRAGTFAGAKDLRWLHMSANELTTLQPGSLDDVENLALLHLDSNKMSTYPIAAMSKLRVVEELKLGGNPMKTIPDNAFQSFGRYMEKLHLDNMGLEKLSDGAFVGVTAIKILNLDNNKLRSLPRSMEFGTLTNLTLTNNPWNCTCQLAPLRNWMDSTRIRPDAVCASPPSQKGKQVRESIGISGCRPKRRREPEQKKPKKGKKH
ncbi:chondroadherin [Mugil cephalus]|uniref:chondroadherin n=1 Tax=Mugil cephalus TaxID=48193 RepID=UPI001FB8132B|nr:chondroadherin [Mugil cephalus]